MDGVGGVFWHGKTTHFCLKNKLTSLNLPFFQYIYIYLGNKYNGEQKTFVICVFSIWNGDLWFYANFKFKK